MSFQFQSIDVGSIALGESPIWDDVRQVLWFVDILAPALHWLEPSSGKLGSYLMPCEIGSVGLTLDSRLILALRSGVHLFEPASGALDFLVHPEPDRAQNRLNDGRVGPDGCFWVGSMHDKVPREPSGALYRITPHGSCERVRDGICVSNGLAWSADGRNMYHADTRATTEEGVVRVYDFDAQTGAVGPEIVFALLEAGDGLPDGATVDEAGFYWSAGVTAGCLNRFSPDGVIVDRIPTPLGAPTMPCFGGLNLDTLYVTALAREDARGTHRGGLVVAASPVRGTLEPRFDAGLGKA